MPQEPAQPTMEYLDVGPSGSPLGPASGPPPTPAGRRRSWVPWVVGLGLVMVVLIGIGLIVVDWAGRSLEMRALVTNVEVSESAMGDVQAAVQEMAVHFDPSTPLTEAEQQAVNDRLSEIAATGLEEVKQGGDLVAAVRVLPWHGDILRAQDAYLAHNQAWQAYLTAAIDDPAQFGQPQDLVNQTFEDARQPMVDAVPTPALFDLIERVETIFAPPPADPGSGGPTQQA